MQLLDSLIVEQILRPSAQNPGAGGDVLRGSGSRVRTDSIDLTAGVLQKIQHGELAFVVELRNLSVCCLTERRVCCRRVLPNQRLSLARWLSDSLREVVSPRHLCLCSGRRRQRGGLNFQKKCY